MKKWKNCDMRLAAYSLGVVLLFFGINFIPEFSVDTYSMFEVSQWEWLLHTSGRIVSVFFFWLFEQLPLSGTEIYFISWFVAVVCMSIAVYILAKMIYIITSNLWICVGISFMTIANIFSIEYFLFVEKGIFMLAILMNVLAVYYFDKYMDNGKLWELIFSFFFLLIAVFIYQTSLGVFVVISLPFIWKHSKRFWEFAKNTFIAAMLYGVNLVIAFCALKLLGSSRINTDFDWIKNVRETLKWFKIVTLGSLSILPKNCFGVLLLLLVVGILCSLRHHERKGYILLGMMFLVAGAYVVGFFPYFSGVADGYSPRILYPFASILGVLLIYYCLNGLDKLKLGYWIMCIGIIATLVIQYVSFTEIIIERYKVNQTDKYLTEVIASRIQEYETLSQQKIQYISFYRDQNPCYCYSDLNTASFLSVRAHGTSWSDLNSLNYYLNSSYKVGDINDSYAEYFGQNNWDVYSENQLIFDGDTLHICAY